MEKITIITVTYNCEKVIEETILNVLSQDYTNIEYIIVDGASTDGTLDILNKYKDKLSKIVSEPDKGVYDAMNKAAKLAKGEWVNFMNAGDTFVSCDVVTKLFEKDHSQAGVVFGDTISVNRNVEFPIRYNVNWWRHKYMPSCHQSIFVRRDVLLRYPFNTAYHIAADIDSFKRMKSDKIIFDYAPVFVARYDTTEGISQNPNEYYKELYSIIFNPPINYIFYFAFKIRHSLGKLKRYITDNKIIIMGGVIIGKVFYILLKSIDFFIRRYEVSRFSSFGDRSYIGSDGIFTYSTITIGHDTYIGKRACLQSAHGKIFIGNHVMFGPNVSIHGGNHVYDKVGTYMNEIRKEPNSDGCVTIEDDVWVGANAIILKGITVGKGSVVSAGAIVTKDVPPYSIVVGIPAKHIKFYWTIDQILEHEKALYPENERYTKEQLEDFFKQYAK